MTGVADPVLVEPIKLAELAERRPRRAEIVGFVLPIAVTDRHAAEQHLTRRPSLRYEDRRRQAAMLSPQSLHLRWGWLGQWRTFGAKRLFLVNERPNTALVSFSDPRVSPGLVGSS
jgi:hypothetical protein